eukprot:5119-Chlamydomonas_euryale.AAC.8
MEECADVRCTQATRSYVLTPSDGSALSTCVCNERAPFIPSSYPSLLPSCKHSWCAGCCLWLARLCTARGIPLLRCDGVYVLICGQA